MIHRIVTAAALGLGLAVFASGGAQAREAIRIVGSSTVYPFSTTVAERFGKTTEFKTPIVESTGSGGGFKLFCEGVGDAHPDISNASRRIKSSEIERCRKNGVDNIVEIQIGYDGIVVANSVDAPKYTLSLRDLYLALAKQVPGKTEGKLIANPSVTWRDVNPALPDVKIAVYGPPPTSGTRDAFAELVLEGGCKTFGWIRALKKADKPHYKAVCHGVREDGAYIESGENDNLIIGKLEADKNALGVFGFSYLDQNADRIQGSAIESIDATFDNIATGAYPVSRPLFFYVKQAQIDSVAGIAAYVAEFTSEKAWGPDGYLADKGLIPLSDDERIDWRNRARDLANPAM